MFPTTPHSPFFSDQFFPWIAQRRSLYGPRTTDAIASQAGAMRALEASPAVQQAGRTLRAARKKSVVPTGMTGGPDDSLTPAARLKPAARPLLVAEDTDAVPTAAALTNAPTKIGEAGPVLLHQADKIKVQMATPPAAVAPENMGLNAVQNNPVAHAVSTQNLDSSDPTEVGRLMERDKQLPSSDAYKAQTEQVAAARDAGLAAGAVPPAMARGGGSTRRRAPSKGGGGRGRGIFLDED